MILYTICCIVLVILVVLSYFWIRNKRWLQKERQLFASYGEACTYKGDTLCYKTYGKGRALVFMAGYGAPSPYYALKDLMDQLASDYQVCVIEPCGYGCSSITKRKRSIEEIVEEMHYVISIQHLHKITFITHSLSGIYALAYIHKYPNDVLCFVGIDSSVAAQCTYKRFWSLRLLPMYTRKFVHGVCLSKHRDACANDTTTDAAKQRMLATLNTLNPNLVAEMRQFQKNMHKVAGLQYHVPCLLFISMQSERSVKDWLVLHKEVLDHAFCNKIIELDGPHFLHNVFVKDIAREIKDFQVRLHA